MQAMICQRIGSGNAAQVGIPFGKLRFLNSGGPGRWPGQSGKELGSTERFLHAFVEQHATEVSRLGSGVLYNTDQ